MPGSAESNISPPIPANPPETSHPLDQQADADFETRKGVPGSKATFPNGLKDVHDMAAAAEALSGMGQEEQGLKVAERKVANLLNPCHCQSGGPCKCCQPKRERADSLRDPSPVSSGSRTPTHLHGVTDGLIEMFKTKATTSSTPPEGSCCSSGSRRPTISTQNTGPTWAQLMQPRDTYLSPDNMHHPAHTSPHVHKTKLYSPYSTSGHTTPRHGRRGDASPGGHRVGGWASSSAAVRPAPPKLRPISDMNKLLGAVFKEDGTVAETIPRSALGLPGISAFDAMAQNGGVKFEAMDMDVDVPIQFPTNEDVVIGACTCGELCDCAGCVTHGIPPRTGSSDGHVHEHGCGENCNSSFDCSDHLSLPSGITSIGHLLSLAAANVPPPAQKRPTDLSIHAHDTRVLPPAVQHSEDAARALGVVTLKPLECCNGRCQCAPGKCVCEKECCGCCVRCACDEDGDSKMNGSRPSDPASSCCSTAVIQEIQDPVTSSCCSTGSSTRQPSPAKSATVTPPVISPSLNMLAQNTQSPTLAPDAAMRSTSRQPSPQPPSTSTPNAALRRASSTAGQPNNAPIGVARRATVTSGVSRSASTGKQASKAMALHGHANHPHSGSHSTHTAHPRPILPKPPSQSGQLGVAKSANSSRIPSPIHVGHATAPSSAQASRHASPSIRPVTLDAPRQVPLPEAAANKQINQPSFTPVATSSSDQSLLNLPPANGAISELSGLFNQQLQDFLLAQTQNASNGQSTQQDQPMSFADFPTDDDFMAFINQLQDDPGLTNAPPSSSEGSVDQPLTTPDLSVDGQPFDRFALPTVSNGDAQSVSSVPQFDPEFIAMLNNAVNNASDPVPDLNNALMANGNPSSRSYSPPPMTTLDLYSHQPSQPLPHLPSSSLGMRSPLDVIHPANNPNTGFAVNLVDLFVANQQASAASAQQAPADQPVYRQLPPQLQQALSHNPALSNTAMGNDKHFGTIGPQPAGGSNMIDLSKPLNASDVERILRALQKQQERPSPPVSQPPAQRSAPDHVMGHRLSNASSIGSTGYVPHGLQQPNFGVSNQHAAFSSHTGQSHPSVIPPASMQPPANTQVSDPNFGLPTDDLLERYLNSNAEYLEDPSSTSQNGMSGWDFSQSSEVGLEQPFDARLLNGNIIRVMKKASGL